MTPQDYLYRSYLLSELLPTPIPKQDLEDGEYLIRVVVDPRYVGTAAAQLIQMEQTPIGNLFPTAEQLQVTSPSDGFFNQLVLDNTQSSKITVFISGARSGQLQIFYYPMPISYPAPGSTDPTILAEAIGNAINKPSTLIVKSVDVTVYPGMTADSQNILVKPDPNRKGLILTNDTDTSIRMWNSAYVPDASFNFNSDGSTYEVSPKGTVEISDAFVQCGFYGLSKSGTVNITVTTSEHQPLSTSQTA